MDTGREPKAPLPPQASLSGGSLAVNNGGSMSVIGGGGSGSSGGGGSDETCRKRELRLLKNREAARECRRKKKEYVKCLEHRVTVLEEQNKKLIGELQKMKVSAALKRFCSTGSSRCDVAELTLCSLIYLCSTLFMIQLELRVFIYSCCF